MMLNNVYELHFQHAIEFWQSKRNHEVLFSTRIANNTNW